jgi:hypothetical protein
MTVDESARYAELLGRVVTPRADIATLSVPREVDPMTAGRLSAKVEEPGIEIVRGVGYRFREANS